MLIDIDSELAKRILGITQWEANERRKWAVQNIQNNPNLAHSFTKDAAALDEFNQIVKDALD